MTRYEFDNTKWAKNRNAYHKGRAYEIVAINFDEQLLGLIRDNEEDVIWVRCENVNLLDENSTL